jgi:hypothetical protein
MGLTVAQAPPVFSGHPNSKRRRASLLIPLLVTALAATGLGFASKEVVPVVQALSLCRAGDASTLIPKDGVLLGVNLDWDSETLAEHRENLGHDPAVVVQFSDIPYDDETWSHTTNAVTQVRATGGALLLTLEPHGGLETMSEEVIAKLATDLRAINDQGTPVVVRFAHEMNGSWYSWGQQPLRYVEVFRKVAAAIHAGAPGTSMMWAPNYGGGYPFTGGQFAARPGTPDFAALDTDHDGTLTMADDTYAPYYPGDDAVDWVGVSLYHWGNQRPWGNNDVRSRASSWPCSPARIAEPPATTVRCRIFTRCTGWTTTSRWPSPRPQPSSRPRARGLRAGRQAGVVAAGLLRRNPPEVPAAEDDQLVRVEEVRDRN